MLLEGTLIDYAHIKELGTHTTNTFLDADFCTMISAFRSRVHVNPSTISFSRPWQQGRSLTGCPLNSLPQSPVWWKTNSVDVREAFFRPRQRFFSAVGSGDAAGSGEVKKGEDVVHHPGTMIRLSKRMSELDICSRREADRLILEGRVLVDGSPAEIGGKVPWNATADQIEVRSTQESVDNVNPGASGEALGAADAVTDGWGMNRSIGAVVLNKPLGFVSGQAEHGNTPAIRLLTRGNLWLGSSESTIGVDATGATDAQGITVPNSWTGFAPAGRLDIDSTGLLIFTQNGVLAKKIISSESTVEKEYVVDVQPAIQETKRERSLDPAFRLPKTTLDLSPLLDGGRTLLESSKHRRSPLLPCEEAKWIVPGERLLIVLTEGRKHHLRRMCRELIGWHVTKLQRIRIGPVKLEDLPMGRWRPLRSEELKGFLKLKP
jgi:23S rRNA pseudouridine2604 synthase